VTNFHEKKEVNDVYTSEIENFLKGATGADKVIAFGTVLRQTNPKHGSGYQPPANDVHVDYTTARAHDLAHTFLAKSDEPNLQYSRFQCINLWRAISPPSQDWPLTVCDARSVNPADGKPNAMLAVEKIPDLKNLDPLDDDPKRPEAFLFEYRPEFRWYYFSDMREDELLAFKLFDSAKGNGRCPHASFYDGGRQGAIPRESVEIRTVLYFK
jgi:hypothetical protein